jgi:hypothetical protein
MRRGLSKNGLVVVLCAVQSLRIPSLGITTNTIIRIIFTKLRSDSQRVGPISHLSLLQLCQTLLVLIWFAINVADWFVGG